MRLGVVQQRADVVFLVTRCFGVFVVVIKTLDVKKLDDSGSLHMITRDRAFHIGLFGPKGVQR